MKEYMRRVSPARVLPAARFAEVPSDAARTGKTLSPLRCAAGGTGFLMRTLCPMLAVVSVSTGGINKGASCRTRTRSSGEEDLTLKEAQGTRTPCGSGRPEDHRHVVDQK
jgi:hypothetical protein